MKKQFIDPLIKRKANLTKNVQYYNDLPLPSVVEISESGTCNRKCSFCPRSAPDFEDIKEFIDDMQKCCDYIINAKQKGFVDSITTYA